MKVMKRIFGVKSDTSPGALYAITKGKFLGEFFVYIKMVGESHYFLSLPKMINREIPDTHFITGIKDGVLEFQEHLPKDFAQISFAQFDKNEK
jgi:hypothetical protein